MKFAYVDESGDREQSDVFVMAGLLIDAYRLRKHTIAFDAMIKEFLAKHPGAPTEIKTKALLNGAGGWSKVDAADRKTFVSDIGDLAIGCTKIYPIAFSFQQFDKAMKGGHGHPFNTYGQATALFIASLVQQKMQDEDGNKGLTVLICDDNRMDMSALSDHLYTASPWFDPIYQRGVKKKGFPTRWRAVQPDERFDRIVNTGFAIKSHHSSFVQVADVVCYVYRRDLELHTEDEAWEGEREYFAGLVRKLDERREHVGKGRAGSCIDFYGEARHAEWSL